MTLRITIEELTDGEWVQSEQSEVRDGDYVLICEDPCYLAGVQAYKNGTHVLTVKGRLPVRPTQGRLTYGPLTIEGGESNS